MRSRESEENVRKPRKWRHRPTVKQIKQDCTPPSDIFTKWDADENDRTRLPPEEEVHLGGLVLAEAFTPSTVAQLYNSLEKLQAVNAGNSGRSLSELSRSRRVPAGGWQLFGPIRRPGRFTPDGSRGDSTLPISVDAVWLRLSHLTPSLTVLAATFTIAEESGDLSEVLRRDYRMEHTTPRVRVDGRLGAVRARIPWSRPARYAANSQMIQAGAAKKRACLELISEHEQACMEWFYEKYPGRFARADTASRPVGRIIFTTNDLPFSSHTSWQGPADIDKWDSWISYAPEGWRLAFNRLSRHAPHEHITHITTFAARREDVRKASRDAPEGTSNWYLTQDFNEVQSPIFTWFTARTLLALYADSLRGIRDRPYARRIFRRTVREARALEEFIISDGLDAATIAEDVLTQTSDLQRFRLGVPEYKENPLAYGKDKQEECNLADLVPELCSELRDRVDRLKADTAATTKNILASAELRQAIANTLLQRTAVILAFVAAVAALIALVVTK